VENKHKQIVTGN